MINRRSMRGALGLRELAALAGDSDEKRANLYRPSDPDAMAAEIRRLRGSGLAPADIAGAVRINLAEVLRLLGDWAQP
jgi:hypothetical protein